MTTQSGVGFVRDVMHGKPITVPPDLTAEDLLERFAAHDVEAFPVTEGDRLVGMVTKLDLLRSLRPESLRETPELVWDPSLTTMDLMRRGVVNLEPDDPLGAAVDLMLETRFHCLPVVTRGGGGPAQLVGVVTRGDLLRALR